MPLRDSPDVTYETERPDGLIPRLGVTSRQLTTPRTQGQQPTLYSAGGADSNLTAGANSQKWATAFQRLNSWEGAVVEVFDTYFVAEVEDMGTGERAIVEFDKKDLSPSDLGLCEEGALFFWAVGYHTTPGGQRTRGSLIAFRRQGRATA